MKIGFIGLGTLGSLMSRHLVTAGHALTVHDLRREVGEPLLEMGAAWADSPAEVARVSETVITSLPGPPQVDEVIFGPRGVLEGSHTGLTLIDMSTVAPDQARRIAAAMTARESHFLEAPVTLGVEGALTASLTIFVGGEADVFKQQLPVLQALGKTILHVGPAGAGQIVKLITNQLWFINAIALGEGLVTGVKAGIDLMTLWEAMKASAGSSWVCENHMSFILSGDYHRSFTLDLCCKDLGLISEIARQHDVPVHMTALAEQIFRYARRVYGGDRGELSPVRLLEDATGVQLRSKNA